MISLAICAAAFGTTLEALLFRGLFDLGRHLQSTAERLIAIGSLLLFLGTLLALDWPAALGLCRLGRQLELGLWVRFLLKVPRLGGDSQSRSISDTALRSHWLQLLRRLPETAGHCLHLVSSVLVTGAAIAWVYPGSGLLVLVMTVAACGVPSLFLTWMGERDLQFREMSVALGSFFLDTLLGRRAIRAHCAERTIGAAQARQLRQWAAAGLHQQGLFVRAEFLQMAITFACTVTLVLRQAAAAHNPAGLLLLIYWSISIPVVGQELAAAARALPAMRNTLLRFLELINSPEDAADTAAPPPAASGVKSANGITASANGTASADDTASANGSTSACGNATANGRTGAGGGNADGSTSAGGINSAGGVSSSRGLKVQFDEVCVVLGGHTLLDHVTLRAAPGEHIGIVGVSGAGKSSLVGCLLGWHEPTSGAVIVDDAPLDRARLVRLRRETVWIAPQVHLFRATLYENLRYGNGGVGAISIQEAVDAADLPAVLRRAPEGLQMPIGEGGLLVSGGEGQRIRTARALCRTGVRLGILDEPAQGLGRAQRRRLLAQIRGQFVYATLFYITHDVSDTLGLDRVLIVERGRIVEQGSPRPLAHTPGSRYRQLLDAEHAVERDLWGPTWRRLRLRAGSLSESEIPAA
jgi:ATP-binding cassette subfamily B protein